MTPKNLRCCHAAHSGINLSWLAGVFEGEGCIGIRKQQRTKLNDHGFITYIEVSVVSTDREMVEPFWRAWGGIYSNHNNKNSAPRNKPSVRWIARSRKAFEFLTAIKPFIRTERVKIKCKLALEFQNQKTRTGCKATGYIELQRDFYKQMKELNQRGAAT